MEKQVLARRDAHAVTSDALSRGTWSIWSLVLLVTTV